MQQENAHKVEDSSAIIDELKKQIKNLQEENKSLRTIIELTPGNLYWKDRNHIYLGCNRGIADRIGLVKCEDIVGHTIYDFLENDISSEAANSVNRIDDEIMQSGKPYEIEEIGFEGKTFITKKRPLYNPQGEIIGLLGISVDISERKQMEKELIEAKEQAEAASQAKSLFLGNMSHDIRTPLNGILGFAQILEVTEKNPQRKQDINLILQSARRLLNLLNEIIDIAHIEHGIPIKLQNIDLRLILEEVKELLQAEITQKNLQLIINIDKNVPNQILIDRLRIHRILLNLIANAIKFTHKGYVKVSCRVNTNTVEMPKLEIIIEDTGIGIPENKLQIIFENFMRLTPSDQSPYKGSGIGLYIVKTFLSDLKGQISVTSELNQGSTFICKLPLQSC